MCIGKLSSNHNRQISGFFLICLSDPCLKWGPDKFAESFSQKNSSSSKTSINSEDKHTITGLLQGEIKRLCILRLLYALYYFLPMVYVVLKTDCGSNWKRFIVYINSITVVHLLYFNGCLATKYPITSFSYTMYNNN